MAQKRDKRTQLFRRGLPPIWENHAIILLSCETIRYDSTTVPTTFSQRHTFKLIIMLGNAPFSLQ